MSFIATISSGADKGCSYLVTMARFGGFIQAPINSTKFSCRVLRNVEIYRKSTKSVFFFNL